MYSFVFLWTMALSPNKEAIKHGLIFMNFMTACMLGSYLSGKGRGVLPGAGRGQGQASASCQGQWEKEVLCGLCKKLWMDGARLVNLPPYHVGAFQQGSYLILNKPSPPDLFCTAPSPPLPCLPPAQAY